MLKKRVGVFLNSISFKTYNRSERTEMAFKERIFTIIEFPDTFLLLVYFSSIWPNLTEIGQVVVEL